LLPAAAPSRANLTEALMGSIRLLNGQLDRAILTEADLEAAQLNEANFANATLNGANLHQGRPASAEPLGRCSLGLVRV
jgi:uncharacterized protein YjbI with pentapeptide repeats